MKIVSCGAGCSVVTGAEVGAGLMQLPDPGHPQIIDLHHVPDILPGRIVVWGLMDADLLKACRRIFQDPAAFCILPVQEVDPGLLRVRYVDDGGAVVTTCSDRTHTLKERSSRDGDLGNGFLLTVLVYGGIRKTI